MRPCKPTREHTRGGGRERPYQELAELLDVARKLFLVKVAHDGHVVVVHVGRRRRVLLQQERVQAAVLEQGLYTVAQL